MRSAYERIRYMRYAVQVATDQEGRCVWGGNELLQGEEGGGGRG